MPAVQRCPCLFPESRARAGRGSVVAIVKSPRKVEMIMSPIAANLQAIRRRISEALQGDSRAVTLVAVAKSQPPAALAEAFEAGVRDFGESYVQEALAKIAALRGVDARWHFIGHVQANKARDIAGAFDWVHGVDRLKVAQALSKARPEGRAPLEVCIQVNISGEATKGGVAPGGADRKSVV